MKKNPGQIIAWAIALILTANITFIAVQHHMPVLVTLTIAFSVAYATKTGAEHVATVLRKTGATR